MFLSWVCASSALLLALASTAATQPGPAALHNLVRRRMPDFASQIDFKLANGSSESFSVHTPKNDSVLVECSTVSACAVGYVFQCT